MPKVLICESDEIAQMLRSNQFHLQTPCAVRSFNEANPLNLTVKQMLNQTEQPQVYFLHDASLKAYSILQGLRWTLDLPENIPLRPLGLRPVHVKRLNLFSAKNTPQNIDLSELAFFNRK